MPHTIEAVTTKELVHVRDAYEKIKMPLLSKLKGVDEKNLDKAFHLAVDGHMYQRRKSGEPYIFHPLEVARICHEEIGLGPTAVICALMHDLIEDTEVTYGQIEEMFGNKIASIVDGLTKLDGLYNVESPQAENLKKVLSTLIHDVRVVLIKMADRIHNMRTIDPMPRHKQLKIAAETSYIYAPLAHRLGLYNFKTEFEDICMKITDPETYEEIGHKIAQSKIEQTKFIDKFILPLQTGLNELRIPYRILSRSKTIASIWNKIKKKKVAFEEIYDLFAVRLIVDVPLNKEKNACWQVYSVVTDVYKPIPERLKDWITTPKGNGYESLHTTVIGPLGRYVEVQIRSERMDEIAEKGFAAHWKYKGPNSGRKNNVYNVWLDNIREILDTQGSDTLEFLNDFKSNLFSEEVYVYTPKGDMKILPKGATALDFAFSIHSDIGYHATAIKVNNKLVPMGYKLSNGDQIHVTTNKNQRPNEDWLKMAVTGKARSKIRTSMKESRRKKGLFGKEILERKLRNLKVDFEENVDMLVKHYGFNSRADLYFAIASERIKLTELKTFERVGNKLTEKRKPAEIPSTNGKQFSQAARKAGTGDLDKKDLIWVNGEPATQYQFSLSKCCNPVPGDDIFAFLSANSGLKIHRSNCPNATHLMANYGYRMLKAEWSGATNTNFVVDLLITGVDSGPGVIQKLTKEISSKLSINIRSFSIEGQQGIFEGKVSIIVKNKDQLSLVIRRLEKIKGISSVIRVDKSYLN